MNGRGAHTNGMAWRANAQPHELQVRLDRGLEKLPTAAYACDAAGRITYFNEHAVRLWGRTPALNDPADRYCGSFRIHGPGGAAIPHEECAMAGALRTGQEQRGEIIIERPDGQRLSVLAHVNPIHDDSGRLLGAVNVLVDISARKQAEEALGASEGRYRSVVEGSLQGILIHQDERICYANEALARMFDYESARELIGRPLWDTFVLPENVSELRDRTRAILTGQALPAHSGWRAVGKRGRSIWVTTTASRIEFGGRPAVVAFYLDITERKRAEEALRESEERHRAILEGLPIGVFIHDGQQIYYANPKALQIIGVPPPAGLAHVAPLDLVAPEHRTMARQRIEHILRTGEILPPVEAAVLRRDGGRVEVEVTSRRIRFLERDCLQVLFQDISERKRAAELEAQIQHTQKLESLGVLAGGIAHDFNNLLTGVLGYASLALMQLPDESPACPMLREIERTAQRAADLTQQMLAYSGRGRFVIQPLRLDMLVQEMTKLLQTVVSKKAVVELHPQPATIEGDATQVRQVVMNLITNASDALEDRVGVIHVRTGIRIGDGPPARSAHGPDELPAGPYAYVEVEDNGCGMSEETLARIFDPFFTTKFTGRGLGLAAVLGIVRGHSGAVGVVSVPGRGTIFEVRFPCAAQAATSGADATRDTPLPRGQGTILVIDDEPTVRNLVQRVLESAGFHVRSAGDGLAGLDLFAPNQHEIEAVLLDLTMPRMDGLEVLRQLRRQNPDLPILIMSGYSEHEVSTRCAGTGASGFIQKPFHPRDLVARVCQLMAANGPTPP